MEHEEQQQQQQQQQQPDEFIRGDSSAGRDERKTVRMVLGGAGGQPQQWGVSIDASLVSGHRMLPAKSLPIACNGLLEGQIDHHYAQADHACAPPRCPPERNIGETKVTNK